MRTAIISMVRLLCLLCAFLLVANVAAYYWPDKANYAPHVYNPSIDVNPRYVRLNKEIEDKFYSRPATSIGSAGESALLDDESGLLTGSNCYRVGPFLNQVNYDLGQAVLFNAGVDFKKSKRASKESNVFRVYLGPYANQTEATDARVELKRKEVLDHFVRKEDDGDYIISLGIYTTKETADDAILLFDGSLEEVKLKSEVVILPESFWLHFSLNEDDSVRQQLSRIDWGEQSAKMGKFECEITG